MNDIPLFVGKNCAAFRKYYSDESQFSGMKDGRIPSLLTLTGEQHRGTVIAAADKASSGADWGFIEIGVRRSYDGGESFSPIESIFTPPVRKYPFAGEEFTSAFAIDPLLMESTDGKVILLVDFYPECKGLHAPRYLEKGSGYVKSGDEFCLKLYTGKSKLDGILSRSGKQYTLHSDGFVYDENNVRTRYYVPHKHSSDYAYSTLGDMYYCVGDKPQFLDVCPPLIPEKKEGIDIYVGNIYVSKGKKSADKNSKPVFVEKRKAFDSDGNLLCIETSPAPFRAPLVSYIFKMESEDGGKTFSQPVDITPSYKVDSDGAFLGVGPGVGITLKKGPFAGRILAPCYIINKALVLISDDNGATWRRNKSLFCENIDECQLFEMPDGKIFCFGRPKGGGKIPVSVSDDGGETYRRIPDIDPNVPQCQKSVIALPQSFCLPDGLENDGRYILLATPTGHSGKDVTRTVGKVFLGRVDNETISWIKEYQITDENKYASFDKYSDFYAYSCLSVIDDSTIGLLYEAYPSGYMTFAKFNL